VTTAAAGRAASAGVLCSAIPMVADLLALRRAPARFYGVFMSVNPVFAALTGLAVLGQSLQPADWLAIAAIVAANTVALGAGGKARSPADTGHSGPGRWRARPARGDPDGREVVLRTTFQA
jgi:inner membrane transporter RhtA